MGRNLKTAEAQNHNGRQIQAKEKRAAMLQEEDRQHGKCVGYCAGLLSI